MELHVGTQSRRRFYELGKKLKTVAIYDVSPSISAIAYNLVKKHNIKHVLFPADALIAATAIENKAPLYTDNIQDYSFIEELQLFKPD